MVVGQSEARSSVALRLLLHEPRAEILRQTNMEETIMDWTTLWMIELVAALLGVLSLHFIWKQKSHTSPRKR
jgi:uncharacterized membrane protein